MNIASEIVGVAQQFKGGDQLLSRIIGTPHNAGAEEQALYVIAAVELHRKVGNLLRCKSSPPYRIGFAVHTIGAVIDAAVSHQYLEQ
ncbi:hypothetical protein D3C71_1844780 [compost metagenome]